MCLIYSIYDQLWLCNFNVYAIYRQLLPEPKKYPKIIYCDDVKTLCDSTLYYLNILTYLSY